MKRDQLTTLVLLAATAAMVYLCYKMLEPFLMPIFGAGIVVILFQPLHGRMQHVVKSATMSAALSTILVLCFIIVPLIFVGGLVAGQLHHFYREVRTQMATQQVAPQPAPDASDEDASDEDQSSGISWLLGSVSQQIARVTHVKEERVRTFMADHIQQVNEYLLGRTTGVLRNASVAIFHLILTIFTMFFLFRDREKIIDKLEQMMPLNQEDTHHVFMQTRDLIVGTIYGTGAVAIMQGVLDGLAFWIAGVPSPLIWGVVIVFFAFIPVIGSTIIWIPITVILIAQGHIGAGIFLVIFIGGVVGALDHIVRPILIGRHTHMHTLLILISVLGGIAVFGPLGIVMGPVTIAITMMLIDILRREFSQKSKAEVAT
ncbi:MAG TPA: AI-2E family transporter [Blastocatellia bacterium]|nr:AI-2E family transporter [Blastocatellia bacterium]